MLKMLKRGAGSVIIFIDMKQRRQHCRQPRPSLRSGLDNNITGFGFSHRAADVAEYILPAIQEGIGAMLFPGIVALFSILDIVSRLPSLPSWYLTACVCQYTALGMCWLVFTKVALSRTPSLWGRWQKMAFSMQASPRKWKHKSMEGMTATACVFKLHGRMDSAVLLPV